MIMFLWIFGWIIGYVAVCANIMKEEKECRRSEEETFFALVSSIVLWPLLGLWYLSQSLADYSAD